MRKKNSKKNKLKFQFVLFIIPYRYNFKESKYFFSKNIKNIATSEDNFEIIQIFQ